MFGFLAAAAAKLTSAGVVAQAATGLGVAVASVTGAGAAGVLPEPVQDQVASVIQAVTPFDLPDSGDRIELPAEADLRDGDEQSRHEQSRDEVDPAEIPTEIPVEIPVEIPTDVPTDAGSGTEQVPTYSTEKPSVEAPAGGAGSGSGAGAGSQDSPTSGSGDGAGTGTGAATGTQETTGTQADTQAPTQDSTSR